MRLTGQAMFLGDTAVITGIVAAKRIDLSIRGQKEPGALCCLQQNVQLLQSVLSASNSEGLGCLVTPMARNVYADFLLPRLMRMFAAVESGDAARACTAAAKVAGCGIGLTPSSDDLLCGYFLALHMLWQNGALPDHGHVISKMAQHAEKKTNRISAAFLKSSAEGLASYDVLQLLRALFSEAPQQEVRIAAERVLSFGASSGGDILTGIVLAITYHYGRKKQWYNWK